METIDFAAKKKNCQKSYPCGNSCISKTKNCRKRLKGQAKTYAGWLQKQAGSLEKEFEKEASKILGKEFTDEAKKLRAKSSKNDADSSLKDKLDQVLNEDGLGGIDNAIIDSVEALKKANQAQIKIAKRQIDRNKRDIKRYEGLINDGLLNEENKSSFQKLIKQSKQEIKTAETKIKEFEAKIKAHDAELRSLRPANNISPFGKVSDEQKAMMKELRSRVNRANFDERMIRWALDDEIRKRNIPRQSALDDLPGQLENELKRRNKKKKSNPKSVLGKAKRTVLGALKDDINNANSLINAFKTQKKSTKSKKQKAELDNQIKEQERAREKAQKELEKKSKEWGIDL